MKRGNHAHLPARKTFGVLLSLLSAIVLTAPSADADNPKPKDAPVETATLNFTKVVVSYKVDGSEGPQVTLDGTLHVASQALLSDAGAPIGFRLRANLSNVFASSADGADGYVAVGDAEGIPAECGPEACAPRSSP